MEPNEVNIPRWYLPSFNKQSVIKKIRDIIGSTPISVSFDDIENKPTTLAGYGITDAVNINSVGTATWKDYVDVIDRYSTNLPT